MNTEITDNDAGIAGWFFFDGECRLCRAWAERVRRVLTHRGFALLPLQSPEAQRHLGMSSASALAEMKLRLADGTVLGGADAIVALARRVWWAWPMWLISRLPGVMPLLRAGYRMVAANRHCVNGVCLITHRSESLDWLPLILLPLAALASRGNVPDWVFMWVLAFALYIGCKWLTLRRACTGRREPLRLPALAYLFLWPGMNAGDFLARPAINPPRLRDWAIASAKTVTGVALLAFAVTRVPVMNPLVVGWLGMVGIVLVLHFGSFHLLALGWRAAGRNAMPLMRAPLLATSLADFWGNRWNTAFHALAHDLVFRPLARRVGVAWATLGVFLISGLIHDLVISLPARGGYGLPTIYFLVQGLGVLLERSRVGRQLGLNTGTGGRIFMLTVTAAPAFWLFHPAFVHNVILPMLQAIGATWNTP